MVVESRITFLCPGGLTVLWAKTLFNLSLEWKVSKKKRSTQEQTKNTHKKNPINIY